MIIGKEALIDYIPHRPPFVMVHKLLSATHERFESEFEIEGTNLLVSGGLFQETGLIENVAQTCAASFGYLDREEAGEPRIGFIGAISKLHVFELPAVGSTIRTVVAPLHQLGNIYLVKGEIFAEGRILLGCEMKIVVTE
jgi:predicted hotdog family 3-hydroxylacyl-ACP dehydratase